MTPETLRITLLCYLVAQFLLAIAYLSQRKLSFSQYMLWGLLALLIPALGPFLVILLRPGEFVHKGKQA